MNHTIVLTVFTRALHYVLSTGCISFRFEKERYTPYTELHGRWLCPSGVSFGEITGIKLDIDGVTRHYGFPAGTKVNRTEKGLILEVSSVGYTAALLNNQCEDGLVTQINLVGLVGGVAAFPNVSLQPDTPIVNYVNYYNGTSMWKAIVCYSLRAVNRYPYIARDNTVRISPPVQQGSIIRGMSTMISHGSRSDYSKVISKVVMKDIDGSGYPFVLSNAAAASRGIVRIKEKNFDREWIQDPYAGLQYLLLYSMRGMNADIFCFDGYYDIDLLDTFILAGQGYSREIDRLIVEITPEKGFVTTIWCYHDGYCNLLN